MSFWRRLGDLMAGEEGPGFHRLVIPLFLGPLLQAAAHGRSNRNLQRDQAGFALIHKPRRTGHRLENLLPSIFFANKAPARSMLCTTAGRVRAMSPKDSSNPRECLGDYLPR